MDHYFTPQPTGEREIKEISYTFHGRTLYFYTDTGVFARDHVDFGTSLLIQEMEIEEEDLVLDLGTGYGPIGITAALLAGKGKVYMVDINERAIELARLNMEKNGLNNTVALVSDGVKALPEGLLFDVVLTNPPIRAGKEVVFRFYEEARERLKDGGKLWVVIQKKQGAESTEKKLKELFSRVERVAQAKGYRVYRAEKNTLEE